jgi:predicted nucleic acid-binding protein
MIIFDASYLIAYLHPNPEPPMDRNNQPVPEFRERVNHLVATLNASEQLIGVPTPALAEVLVRAGLGKLRYMQTIGDAYRFKVLPFDQRAAIDASELIAKIKEEHKRQPLITWAKVKFDIQIAAIGKTEGATVIYSDDTDIEAHGRRLNIPVKRICDLDLPSPPAPVSRDIQAGPAGEQAQLFALTQPLLQRATETAPEQPEVPKEVQNDSKPESAQDASGPRRGESDELKADPHSPLPFEEATKDVLRVKPPEKPLPAKKADEIEERK